MATISSPEAVAVGRKIEVFGVHFMARVMRFVEEETQARKFYARIKRAVADVLPLPACENSLDVASMAFGIQNMSGRRSGLKEIARVLKLGGKMLALAMVFPDILKFRRSLTRLVSIAISVPGAITSDIRPCY